MAASSVNRRGRAGSNNVRCTHKFSQKRDASSANLFGSECVQSGNRAFLVTSGDFFQQKSGARLAVSHKCRSSWSRVLYEKSFGTVLIVFSADWTRRTGLPVRRHGQIQHFNYLMNARPLLRDRESAAFGRSNQPSQGIFSVSGRGQVHANGRLSCMRGFFENGTWNPQIPSRLFKIANVYRAFMKGGGQNRKIRLIREHRPRVATCIRRNPKRCLAGAPPPVRRLPFNHPAWVPCSRPVVFMGTLDSGKRAGSARHDWSSACWFIAYVSFIVSVVIEITGTLPAQTQPRRGRRRPSRSCAKYSL